jgi:hypothetical protein
MMFLQKNPYLLIFAVVFLSNTGWAQNPSPNNLLKWNKWQKIQGKYLQQVKITKDQLFFLPFFNGGVSKKTGWKQSFQIKKAGSYQLHFRGIGGSTGKFQYLVRLGGKTKTIYADNWKVAVTYDLKAGLHRLEITLGTSNVRADVVIWKQPLLLPVVHPTVDVDRLDFPPYPMPKFYIRTAQGNLILLGFSPLKTPIRFPGIGYGFLLDPKKQILVLGLSTKPGFELDFFMFAVKKIPFPRVYLQALSLKPPRFGSISWVEAKNL